MTDATTLRKSQDPPGTPTGVDTLRVRERYLHSRRHTRWPAPRSLVAVWVGAGALLSWLFVVGITALH
ncbi:MAG: hypothetical protein ACYDAC_06645 [Candidatus Dormibacteria bacterium]